ncbi:MAG TPA: tetratricopeptide repeat protein [Candidatus Latescibacteria bacterium]|nr:tetratricopeptide repeat protein [Candidatus Latescibacterota bacterium]MDP7634387.1 tetratricopeptide repeat protein [Candidatus Latescibacterota bacterium]HJN28461.1 tetratricopeptide repeat protein [Candidatus Latescibacterota bacterium]
MSVQSSAETLWAKRTGPARHWFLGGWLLLAVVLGVVYAPAVDFPFHYDDDHSIVTNPHIRDVDGVGRLFDPRSFSVDPDRSMFRPLVVLSYVLNYELGGLDPSGYHLLNVFVHLACSVLVGWFSVTAGFTRHALPVAALFSTHPVAVEVATYVSARSESLAAIGLSLSLIAYVQARRTGCTIWAGSAIASMGWGLLAKATAIVSLALVSLWELRTGKRWIALTPFALMACVYLVQMRAAVGTAVGEPVRSLFAQGLTQTKALVYYLNLLVIPTRLNVEHAFSESHIPDLTVIAAGLVVCSVAIVIWRCASSLLRFAFLGSVLTLAPSTLVPLNVLVNDHRLYPVLALLAPALIKGVGYRAHSRRQTSLFVILLAAMSLLSAQRVGVWSTEMSLWTDAVAKAPGMHRAHLHLGGQYEAAGDTKAALGSFRTAVELAPHDQLTNYNYGNALLAAHDSAGAITAFRKSLDVAPGFANAAINLALLHNELGDPAAAIDLLSSTIGLRPGNAELYRRRALIHRGQRDDVAAERDLRAALSADPTHVESLYSLGNLLSDYGRSVKATQRYEAAIRQRPDHQGAIFNLALLSLTVGNPSMARQVCEAALLVGPVQGKLYYLLGQAYDELGRSDLAITNYQRFLQSWPVVPQMEKVVRERMKLLSDG